MARDGTEERRILSLIWRIENLSYWQPGFHGRGIHSSHFNPICIDGIQLFLTLFPKGEDDSHLQVMLSLFRGFSKYLIDCEWSLLDDLGSPLFTETLENIIFSFSKPVRTASCPTHEEVFETRKSSFLPLDTLTVRCRVWMSEKVLDQNEHISARTRINFAERSFEWRIQALSSLQLGQKVTTRIQDCGASVFLLIFSLTGESVEEAKVGFHVIPVKSGDVHLTLNISVLKEEKEMKWVDAKYVFRKVTKESWDLQKSVPRKEMLERTFDWLCGDDLNLLCKVTAIKKFPDQLTENPFYRPTNMKLCIPKRNRHLIVVQNYEVSSANPSLTGTDPRPSLIARCVALVRR